jgi:hypothetical protein
MTVTIISKSGLRTQGSQAKEAAAAYRKEISSTERKIQVKVEGQQAEAVQAFVNKLNSLSYVLNESYPKIFEEYSEIVLDYVSNLEALGFEADIVQTKAGDIQQIKEWLSVSKAKEFLDEGDELLELIKTSSEALAMSPHSVDYSADPAQYAYGVARRLTDLGAKREETHNSLMTNLNTFKSKLDSANSQLEGLKGTLKNAQFISSLPVSEALKLISKNYLAKENMKLLDSIQNSGDGEALKVILSEEDYGEDKKKFFKDLGGVDATNISNPMMDVVYNRVNVEFSHVNGDKSVAMDNLRAYIYAIANQDKERAAIYFEKLILGGDRYAGVISTTARALVPELPDSSSNDQAFQEYDAALVAAFPQLAVFNDKLKRAGLLTTLFESLYALGVGKETQTRKYRGHEFEVDTSTVLDKLTLNSDGFSFLITDHVGIGVTDKVRATSHFYNTEDEVDDAKSASNIAELKERRKKAAEEFALELAKMAGDKVLPGTSTILDLISSSMTVDEGLSSRLGLANMAGEATFGDLYQKVVGDKLANTSTILSHLENFGEIEQELTDNREKLKASYFDIGGRSLFGGDGFVKYDLNYDLQSILKIDDLEKNGLRSNIYHQAEGNLDSKIKAVKDFEKKMQEEFNKKGSLDNQDYAKEQMVMTKRAYELFMDKGSKTVSDVPMEEIYQGLNRLKNDTILNNNYGKWNLFGLTETDNQYGFGPVGSK